MKAGASQVCITPAERLDLTGYWDRVQPMTGVHDDIFAKALFLEADREKLLWLHCDLLGLDIRRVRALRPRLASQFGLAERQIVMSATHTHAGPATIFLHGCGRVDPTYLDRLDGFLTEAAAMAVPRAEQVTMRFAEGCCSLGIDRRRKWYKFERHAHTDATLPVLAFENVAGEMVAVITNYAMHNVTLGGGNRLVSADWAGVAAGMIRASLPGGPVAIISNGCAGNLNPPETSNSFEGADRVGKAFGEDALLTFSEGEPYNRVRIASVMKRLALPYIVPTREQLSAECEESIARYGHRAELEEWRDSVLGMMDAGAGASCDIDLQAFRIGPACFVAIPAEVFSRMANDLQQAFGPHTYVVGYANGCISYLPFREIYEEGGYEPDLAFKVYGTLKLAPESFDLVREAAVELLNRLNLKEKGKR